MKIAIVCDWLVTYNAMPFHTQSNRVPLRKIMVQMPVLELIV